VAVEYTVRVPHCAHVEHLGTVNGTLRVSGIERVEDLRTVNGNIEVYEGGGSVHAHTTNGNVHLELLHVPDKNGAIAETTNGSLLLAVPADTHADLETRCLNGNFFSELPVTFESTLKRARCTQIGPGRRTDPVAYGEWRDSIGGFAIDGLTSRALRKQAVTKLKRRITTMKKSILWIGGGTAALSIALLALPSRSAALKSRTILARGKGGASSESAETESNSD